MPKSFQPAIHCRCCRKPLSVSHTDSGRKHPDGCCDAVCAAALSTLTPEALRIWRGWAWKLDLNPTRAST